MLRVIGAGFGRTGTMSLKVALEQLGVGPCYHMAEVFAHPEHVALWHAIGGGHPPDWEALFGGYQAAVDLPTSEYYAQLLHAYPQAKVVLTVRDPHQWYESASSTIFRVGRDERPFELPPGFVEMVGAMMGRSSRRAWTTGRRRSRPSSGTTGRCRSGCRPSGCWCMTCGRAGRRCVASWGSACPRAPSRA